jgi:hypothetical protein
VVENDRQNECKMEWRAKNGLQDRKKQFLPGKKDFLNEGALFLVEI